MTKPACAASEHPPDYWDVGPEHENRQMRSRRVWTAIGVCQTCPLIAPCEAVARETNGWGVWAGKYWINGVERSVAKPPKTERRPGAPVAHGRAAGYRLEMERGLEPCDACTLAYNAAAAERQRRVRARRTA